MAKNHYNRFRASGPTPPPLTPQTGNFQIFPRYDTYPISCALQNTTSGEKIKKSNEGLTTDTKTLLSANASAFQSPYKPFFHTFRPRGPKARRKKATLYPSILTSAAAAR